MITIKSHSLGETVVFADVQWMIIDRFEDEIGTATSYELIRVNENKEREIIRVSADEI